MMLKQAWWAVHTSANKEAFADMCLRDQGVTTYFPYTHEWIPSPTSKIKADLTKVAALTRYLFVRVQLSELGTVNQIAGGNICRAVHAPGGNPYPIADTIMDKLMQKLGPSGKVYRNPSGPSFEGRIGDYAKGLEGWPHWGLVGMISRIVGEQVAIKLMIMGAMRDVIVPTKSVQIVSMERSA